MNSWIKFSVGIRVARTTKNAIFKNHPKSILRYNSICDIKKTTLSGSCWLDIDFFQSLKFRVTETPQSKG